MDPFTSGGEHRHGRSLIAMVLSLLCAVAGMSLATTSTAADETAWLVTGADLSRRGAQRPRQLLFVLLHA